MRLPLQISLAAALTAGCAARPPARVEGQAPVSPAVDAGPSAVESEIGGMSEYEVGRAVEALRRDLGDCFGDGSARLAALGGHLQLNLRVAKTGAVKWAYLRETTLGDRQTERCILDRARAKTWPRPLGGDGLVQTSFDIDPRSAAIAWDEKRVQRVVTYAKNATVGCRRGISGGFTATVYLRPDGRVLSAGVAPPNEQAEGAADCVVEAVRKLRFQAAPKLAKVSFEIK